MNKAKRTEDGLVAIVVAGVIMIILSLLTLGFAKLMQREQRQAVDRALSSQAFYAAESGVNDAVDMINTGPTPVAKTDCNTGAPYDGNFAASLNATYSCVLVNPTPNELSFTPLTSNLSKLMQLKAKNGQKIARISLSWAGENEDPAMYNGCGSNPFPVNNTIWRNTISTAGLLRVDLVPVQPPPFTRDGLAKGAMNLYLYPVGGCGSTGITYQNPNTDPGMNANQGQTVKVRCNAASTEPHHCTLNINIPAAYAQTTYALRLKTMYHDSDVSVRAYNNSGVQLELAGAQAIVDATGKAADVLRRIQVRVPLNKDYVIPDYIVQFRDQLCKQINYTPDEVRDDCTGAVGSVVVPGPSPSGNSEILTWCDLNPCKTKAEREAEEAANPGSKTPNYKQTFYNNSNNPNNIVASCTWDFGDGTTAQNQSCYYKDKITHTYPSNVAPRNYTIKLTVKFNNGAPPKQSPPQTQWVPS
jgi:Tfp pilus assembly protein PilX